MPIVRSISNPRELRLQRDGFALVIVLGCATLLSLALVVLLVLTRSERIASKGSAEVRGVDLLSGAALDSLIEDFRKEIKAGSINASSHTAGDPPVSSFIPKTPQSSVPCRTVTAAAATPATAAPFLKHYLKASQRGVPFHHGTIYDAPGAIRASSVSTGALSKNGRLIRKERWNEHRLFGTDLPTDFTVPDWVYVTREHVGLMDDSTAISDDQIAKLKNVIESNPNFVLGRFAYTIHDIGARLDINVAGNKLPAKAKAKKGLLHQADLSVVPGILKPDQFLDWRSKWSATKDGDTSNQLFDPLRDFVSVPNGDQTFVSRGDLIRFAKFHPDILSSAALPYLTTFSRELNRPSFRPRNPTGPNYRTVYNYEVNADTPPTFSSASEVHPKGYNLDLANARNSAGEFVIARRFPLSRISWITKDGPAAGKADDVKRHFGLVWNAAELCWDYTGPDLPSRTSFIKRLDQIPSGREPDFFELLMAGILEGSLGVDTTKTMGAVNTSKLRNPNIHVIQIGACIIDQATTHSIPTQIRIDNSEQAGTPTYSLFGIKNLPYPHGFTAKMYRPSTTAGNTSTRDYIYTWLIPELWNPHGNARTHPGWKFRMRIVSGTSQGWVTNILPTASIQLPDKSWTNNKQIKGDSVVIGSPDRFIEWDGETDFSELTIPTPDNSRYLGKADDTSCLQYSDFTDGGIRIIGFCISKVFAEDRYLTGVEEQGYTVKAKPFYIPFETGMTIDLQVNDGSGWRTYWQVESGDQFRDDGRIEGLRIGAVGGVQPYFMVPAINSRLWAIDPFSTRFGWVAEGFNGVDSNEVNAWADLKTFRPTSDASSGLETSTYGPEKNAFSTTARDSGYTTLPDIKSYLGRLPQNIPWDEPGISIPGSRPGNWFYMIDSDGITRFGDGFLGVSAKTGNPLAQGSGRDMEVRPYMLNRPFRSVGELGYVYRGLPWKTLDLSTARSADNGLLDLFCMTESEAERPVVGGRISPNTQIAEVLSSMLSGAERTEDADTGLSLTIPGTIAKAIITEGSDNGPYLNRAEIATRLGRAKQASPGTAYPVYKIQREAVARALGEATQTRTWNLLIDLIAQVGRLTPGSQTLESFQVTGEQHYWIHLAIDRYTGEVIDRKIEIVTQ